MKVSEITEAQLPGTFEEATAVRDQLEAEAKRIGAVLNTFPKGKMGMTPDEVKSNPEFIKAKSAYATAFKRLQDFNTAYLKTYANEIRMSRRR